jgi:hypothetical protein
MLVMCRATERASRVPTVVEASRGVNTMWLRGEITCGWLGPAQHRQQPCSRGCWGAVRLARRSRRQLKVLGSWDTRLIQVLVANASHSQAACHFSSHHLHPLLCLHRQDRQRHGNHVTKVPVLCICNVHVFYLLETRNKLQGGQGWHVHCA